MPPPRKIDLLPPEFRKELQDELRESGFADYEGIAERLNFRLEGAGFELRIQKSAIHSDCATSGPRSHPDDGLNSVYPNRAPR